MTRLTTLLTGVSSIAVAVLGLAMSAAPASAVTPAPAWQIHSIALPTDLSSSDFPYQEPERFVDRYQVTLRNVGGAATNGEPIILTDTLPPGVTTAATPWGNQSGGAESESGWGCTTEAGTEDNSVVTCTGTGFSFGGGETPSLVLTEDFITIPVTVSPGAPSGPATSRLQVSGGGAPAASASFTNPVNSPAPPFGFLDSGNLIADAAGAPDTQAGGHPNSLTTSFDFPTHNTSLSATGGEFTIFDPVEDVKDIVIDLPPGFIGNPLATPRCPWANFHQLKNTDKHACPAGSQVGNLTWDGLQTGANQGESPEGTGGNPIYNLPPEPGHPAEFGVHVDLDGTDVFMYPSVRTGSDYGVRVVVPDVLSVAGLFGIQATFFGNPTVRDGGASPGGAFFTNPTDCSGEPLRTTIHADTWEHPAPVPLNADGSSDFNAANFNDPRWQTTQLDSPALGGCEKLGFTPSVSVQPDTTAADSPSGLNVDVHVPQNEDVNGFAEAQLKDATVTLPAGVAVNPAEANGLQACAPAQIGINNAEKPSCPDASRIGTVEVETPLLEHALQGSVYLAQQDNNPFGSLLAIYLVVEGEGVLVKLAGHVEADPASGQLTTTFSENPRLPFSDLKLHLFGGPRAPLITPPACGTYGSKASLTPWSGTPAVPLSDTFGINTGCAGGFAPSFAAGTTNNQAGAFSPFSVTFSRQDGEQRLGSAQIVVPPGLLGVLKSVVQCPEPQASRGECGPESQIGETTAAAGSGEDPFWVKGGRVYLTGPYKGAPFGLSIVVPAVAGPFNLGNVNVRAQVNVDPHTAQITVTSDPLPTILQGIPLDIRTVNVTVNRPGFMFNPTNCAPMSVSGTITSTQGASAEVSSSFEAANCANLPFKPSFKVSTQGKASRADGASLDVKVTSGTGQANIGKVKVDLPKQLPSRLTTLQKACLAKVFEANPAGCHNESDVGTATAVTPVLAHPLTGPAYLVSHGGAAFPDLEIVLQGEGITLILDGNTDIKKGITSSAFKAVPDAPVSSFELKLPIGKYSVLGANGPASAKYSLCGQTLAMPTAITGQNGAVVKQTTRIAVAGCAKAKVLTRTQKLAVALKTCRTKSKGKRAGCEKRARKQYAAAKAGAKKKHDKQH